MQKRNAARHDEPDAVARPPRLPRFLLAGSMALWVCRPLWASEGAALYGDGLPVVMLWIVLMAAWLLGTLRYGELTIRFGWIDVAVLFLIVSYAVSAMVGATHDNPRPAVNLLWEWVGLGLGYFAARQWIADRHDARAVLIGMLALTLTLSAYGIYQRCYEFPQTRALYAAAPDATLRSAGVWYAPGSPQRALFESRLQCNEPLATFALTNSLAGLLAAWFTVALGLAVWSRDQRRWWLAIAVAALPIAVCLALTKSRSGLIAASAGVIALGTIVWGRRVLAAAVGTMAVLAIVAGLFLARDQGLLGKAATSLGYRFQYWQATWPMIQDHPLMGCGPGSFQDYYTRYKLPGASEEIADPHNFLLEIWATAGTPAAVALLAVLVGLGAATCSAIRKVEHPATEHGPVPRFAVPAGAGGGYLLAAVAAVAAPSPPGYGLLLAGIIVTAVLFWAFNGWIRVGRVPAVVPGIAAGVLLVHLLAAGGISYAGLAGSFWLLTAIAINLAGHDRPKPLAVPARWALLAVVLTLAAACQRTGYAPVLRAQAAMLHAERLPPDSPEVATCLQRAIEADPWATAPLERLADLEFQAWHASPNAERLRQFERYRDRVLKLCPQSSSAWLLTGDYYQRAYQKTGHAELAQRAAAAFARAASLYPTSAPSHAKLALALKACGDGAGFRRASARALELDRLTPHADKKLSDKLRNAMRGQP
jgi:hypothetical protein